MSALTDYRRHIEQEDLPRLRQSLAPLESGKMRLASRTAEATAWRDITQGHIAHLKKAIVTYETILKRLTGEAVG